MTKGFGIDLALQCYPGWWRERYAEEVRTVSNDLTTAGRSPLVVTLNLLGGAVRTRSRAQGMPKTFGLWSLRTRVSIAAATLPWMLVAPFVWMTMGNQTYHSSAGFVTWSGFSLMPRHFQVIRNAIPVPAPPLTPAGPLVTYSALAVTVLFLLTFFVLIGGWSGLTGAIRRSSTQHRRRLRLLAWAPVFALLTDFVLVIAQASARPDTFSSHQGGPMIASGGNPTALHLLNFVLPTVSGVGWLASIACVAIAARRAEVAPTDLRFGKSVAVVVAPLFALLMVAYATWGIGLILQARQAAKGNYTTIGYSHAGLWLPMMLALGIGVVLSGMSALAARSSWKVISVTFA